LDLDAEALNQPFHSPPKVNSIKNRIHEVRGRAEPRCTRQIVMDTMMGGRLQDADPLQQTDDRRWVGTMCPEINLICLRCYRRDQIRLPCVDVQDDHHTGRDACKGDTNAIGHPVIPSADATRQTTVLDVIEHDPLVQ